MSGNEKSTLTRCRNEHRVRIKCKLTIIQPPSGMQCWVVWEGHDEACWIEGPILVVALRIFDEEITADAKCIRRDYRRDIGGKSAYLTDYIYDSPDGVSDCVERLGAGRSGFEEGYLNALVLGKPCEDGGSAFSWIDESHLRFSQEDAERLLRYFKERAEEKKNEKAERQAAKEKEGAPSKSD